MKTFFLRRTRPAACVRVPVAASQQCRCVSGSGSLQWKELLGLKSTVEEKKPQHNSCGPKFDFF